MGNNVGTPPNGETLYLLLELMCHLEKKMELRKEVIKKVKQEAKNWLNDGTDTNTRVPPSIDKEIPSLDGYLQNVITRSNEIRERIIKPASNDSLYSHFLGDTDSDIFYDLFVDHIFPYFTCLYYMYYECSAQCEYIMGGRWKNEKVDGTSGADSHIERWLTDKNTEPKIGDETLLIPRGFEGVTLTKKDGKHVFGRMRTDSILLIDYGGELQFALYYMLFLPTQWHRSMTGHAVLFLKAFCDMVMKHKFHNSYPQVEAFEAACHHIIQHVSYMLSYYLLVPVTAYSSLSYDDLIEPVHFSLYLYWLRKHLVDIMNSLEDMRNDTYKWTEEALKESETYGPFPWGFVFRTPYDSDMIDALRQKLDTLRYRLRHFQRNIEKLPYEVPRMRSVE